MKFWTYNDYTSRNGDVPNAAAAWDEWQNANESFHLFWQMMFGEMNERWIPPVNINELRRLV
jgi:hypothetical protein